MYARITPTPRCLDQFDANLRPVCCAHPPLSRPPPTSLKLSPGRCDSPPLFPPHPSPLPPICLSDHGHEDVADLLDSTGEDNERLVGTAYTRPGEQPIPCARCPVHDGAYPAHRPRSSPSLVSLSLARLLVSRQLTPCALNPRHGRPPNPHHHPRRHVGRSVGRIELHENKVPRPCNLALYHLGPLRQIIW